jgi:hypothetical protein
MTRAFVIIAVVTIALGACSERAVCPAFQSAYIHDKEALRKKYSYFLEDSTPKILTASKNRYLVAEPVPYRKKERQMRTVEMTRVLVEVPDSLSGKSTGADVSMEELDRAARSVIDSTYIVDVPAADIEAVPEDSAYVITKDREMRVLRYNAADSLVYDPTLNRYVAQRAKYYVEHVGLNVDMDNYMWYLRDHLVLPDVRLARAQQASERAAEAKLEKKKKRKERKGGFFKNLFKKKAPADSVDTLAPAEEEYNFINLDTLTRPAPPQPDPQRDPEIDPQSDFLSPIDDPQQDIPAAPVVPGQALPNDPRRDESENDDGF